MIKELTQFVKDVPHLVRERAVEPKAGLHILIRFDGDGQGSVVNSERYLGKKHGETSLFLKECATKQVVGWMIDTNKCFDLPAKGIHSASPYCYAFKRESWIGGEKYPMDTKKADILGRSEAYFEKCFDKKYGLDEIQRQKALQFRNYLKAEMPRLLEISEGYAALDSSDYIIIYLDELLEKYLAFSNLYVSEGLFNTAEYNVELDGEVHGTSNFHNGFNSKKPFLTHQTASFDITSRISATEAKALSDFTSMAGKRLFPNPIPMFIDHPELTEEAIKIYHKNEDMKITHREIISELWKQKKDLGNYYLLYYSAGAIQDFDFVAKFQYLLSGENDGEHKDWTIENVTEIREKDKTHKKPIPLISVFDFERMVISQLFNNALVKVDEKKGEISMRYFDDMDPKYYRPALYTLLLKYRKPIYDFIYKSMRSSIGRQQFDDICLTGILDDLKEDKDYTIKSKLNIYFSLHQYFDKTKNPMIMPSKLEEHKALMAKVVDDPSVHFTSDDAYAFGAGQLIYYLLSQSEAGERTHAVLEPFLQKTNHSHFNDAIAAILLKYKHAIGFDFKRFNQLAAEVLGYTPEKGLQELRPILLAGYFCPNVLYTKKTDFPS
jgi:CRISPR-associated protein Csh1